MKINFLLASLLLLIISSSAQNIRTIELKSPNSKVNAAIFPLGSTLELSFDDLDGDNKEYQYKIEHMTYDWKPSNLNSNQYINGFNQNYINNITNSFNTLQNYTHYSVQIPNQNMSITKSGNYLISVLNDDDELVFSRRCVFYESLTEVGVSVLRSRNVKTLDEQQTVHFIVNYPNLRVKNPNQEINVVVFQNNNWHTAIFNLQPQYFKVNQLIYNYVNKTNFFGGNEFLNFDSKQIRNTTLHIAKTELTDVFHHHLYMDKPRVKMPYRHNPDINGDFIIRTLDGNDNSTEADYSTVHFYLDSSEPFPNKDVYVYGAFNNFSLEDLNRMQYDEKEKVYRADFSLKQGFYNYGYVTVDHNSKKVNLTEIDGSFSQTENEYTVIVYYKPIGDIYYQAIGVGNGFFNQNR